jgi:hypothetical protein
MLVWRFFSMTPTEILKHLKNFIKPQLVHISLINSIASTRTLYLGYLTTPVTVAEPSKACTVFARSEAGIVGSNPTQVKHVWYVYVFILCLGIGLATTLSLVQGDLPSVKLSKRKNNLDTVQL